MKWTKIAVVTAAALLSLGALTGAAVKAKASSGVKSATPAAATVAADQSTTAEPASGMPDGDNIQQGDQTTLDATATSQSSPESTEAAGEATSSETLTNSDGPGGHADEPGNANADHQFQGVE
jgi:hypothetical protein